MIDAHTGDPKLYEMLMSEIPHRAGEGQDFAVRLHGVFRLAIFSRAHELQPGRDLDKLVFVVAHMVDSLSHGAVFRRPANISLEDAKSEAIRAVMAYLRS
jgi:hypothetical protein